MRKWGWVALIGVALQSLANADEPASRWDRAGFINVAPAAAGSADQLPTQHLPANALGAIFSTGDLPGYITFNQHNGIMVSTLPARLTPRQFDIRDETTGIRETTHVAPVQTLEFNNPKFLRVFLAPDARARDCVEAWVVHHKVACEAMIVHLNDRVARGEIADVTEEAGLSWGLFRIAPARGFIPGHSYIIRALDDPHDAKARGRGGRSPRLVAGSPPWAYPATVRIVIDDRTFPGWSNPPALVAVDAADSTSYLEWRFPDSYSAWARSINTLTELYDRTQRTPPGELYLRDPLTQPRTIALSRKSACMPIRGWASFYEVTDEFFHSGPAQGQCIHAKLR